jgi:hypothetical protein
MYFVDATKNVVVVVRIVHDAMDVERHWPRRLR